MTLGTQRCRVCLLVGLALAIGTAAVRPHTLWPTYYSAKSSLSVDDERGLRATVVIEVPAFEMVNSFRQHFSDIDLLAEIEAGRFEVLEKEFQQLQLDTFAAALYLEVDGRAAAGSWQPADSSTGAAVEGFFVYSLQFVFERAPDPSASRLEARLMNNALVDEAVMLANFADAGDGWEVASSSIPPPEEVEGLPDGAALVDEMALWTMDDAKRDLQVVFERHGR